MMKNGIKDTALYQQFFALLQGGLWGTKPDCAIFESANWTALFALAKQQTVDGIFYEGIMLLPTQMQPPRTLLMQLYARIVTIEKSHERLNATLKHIYTLYRDHGVASVLLKGQGVASCYPIPSRRVCGDIDLYIGKGNYNLANQIAIDNGLVRDISPENVKHAHFEYQGVSVENHKRVNVLFRIGANLRFQRYMRAKIFSDNRQLEVSGISVPLPSAEMDMLISFVHLYIHFIEGGLGLRHLSDLALLLNKYGNEIDRVSFVKRLAQFRLTRDWQIFTAALADYLGLDKTKVPAYSNKYANSTIRVMQLILSDGNFGTHRINSQYRPKGYFSGKLISFIHQLQRRAKVLRILPADTLLYSFKHFYVAVNWIIFDKILCRIKK